MVSDKVIIVIITLAILLSVASIAVTLASLNSAMIPNVPPVQNVKVSLPDKEKANVGLTILTPPTGGAK